MNPRIQTLPRRVGVTRAIFALVAVVASLFVLASPAGAATTSCTNGDQANPSVFVDESPNGKTVLTMKDGILFVNGESCGPASTITVFDTAEVPKTDTVIFDLKRGPFRSASNSSVFVNLILNEPGPQGKDKVKIKGTSGADRVAIKPDFIFVDAFTEFAPNDSRRLIIQTGSENFQSKFKPYFILKGGDDVFRMTTDSQGRFYFGFLSVKGGAGDDLLVGGPGRQRFKGGRGNDELKGFGGNDILAGNAGDDIIRGGRGKDKITGGSGRDKVWGNGGADTFFMADGTKDRVRGGKGADTCDCDSKDFRRSVKAI